MISDIYKYSFVFLTKTHRFFLFHFSGFLSIFLRDSTVHYASSNRNKKPTGRDLIISLNDLPEKWTRTIHST